MKACDFRVRRSRAVAATISFMISAVCCLLFAFAVRPAHRRRRPRLAPRPPLFPVLSRHNFNHDCQATYYQPHHHLVHIRTIANVCFVIRRRRRRLSEK